MTAATSKRFRAKNGLSANNLTIEDIANPVNNGDAINKQFGFANFVAFDSNNVATVGNLIRGRDTTSAGGTVNLTAASAYNQITFGSNSTIYILPAADVLPVNFGFPFHFINNSTGSLTVKDNSGATLIVLAAGTNAYVMCRNISSAAGLWDIEYLGAKIISEKVFTVNNTITLTGTDGTTLTLPSVDATLAALGVASNWSAAQTFQGGAKLGTGVDANRYVNIDNAGILTARYNDNSTVTNLYYQNLDQTNAVLHGLKTVWQFATTASSTAKTAGSITIAKEQTWTGTTSTQDSSMTLKVARDGSEVNAALFSSSGQVNFYGAVLTDEGGIGYTTGAGGTVTQGSSSGKSTAVTLNKLTGQITMDTAALAADTTVAFDLNNTKITAGDLLVINHIGGGVPSTYNISPYCQAEKATIYVRNVTSGSLSEALVLSFALIKSTTS